MSADVYMQAYDEFLTALRQTDELGPNQYAVVSNEGFKLTSYDQKITARNKKNLGKIWYEVVNFLKDNRCSPNMSNITFDLNKGVYDINEDVNIASIGHTEVLNLLDRCGLRKDRQLRCAEALAGVFSDMQSIGSSPGLAYDKFISSNFSLPDSRFKIEKGSLNDLFSLGIMNTYVNNNVLSQEAFGTTVDHLIPDVRMVLSITIMKFHSGILNRIVHRLPSATPLISYLSHYLEIYNYHEASSKNFDVRNSANHRIPLIDMYLDSSPINAKLKRIEVLKTNDTTGEYLYADDVLKFDTLIPMYDMALVDGKVGFDHIDHTDLVADGVFVESILVSISDGSADEIFEIPLKDIADARLTIPQNNKDSADRVSVINQMGYSFNNLETTVDGTVSSLFASVTGSEYVLMKFSVNANINLKDAGANGMASGKLIACTKDDTDVSTATKTLVDSLTIKFLGFKLDARWNEENMRRSTVSTVLNAYSKAFEIPPGINVFMDYALQQVLPDTVMAKINEVISLGQDDRAVDIVQDTLKFVFDSIHRENQESRKLAKNRIAAQYAAGMQVRPFVIMGKLDLSLVKNVHRSFLYGDIRNYVEYQLLKVLSLLMTKSFYNKQLNDNEQVTFNIITSPIISDLLLGTPHIFQHIQEGADPQVDGTIIERSRILPSGIRLNIITSHYKKLRNKIIGIPFRPDHPESELNFGHNWDCGSLVANYTNTMYDAAYKRIYANSRELLVPTNPDGFMFEVVGIDDIIENDTIINMLDTEIN